MGIVQWLKRIYRTEEELQFEGGRKSSLSNFADDIIVLRKIDLLTNSLMRKRMECMNQEKIFFEQAKQSRKDKGLARLCLLKRKIALETAKNIDSKIELLQKQKNSIQ